MECRGDYYTCRQNTYCVSHLKKRLIIRHLYFGVEFAIVFLGYIFHPDAIYVCLSFMNFVEPIRDRKKFAQIKNLLRGERRYRDLLLFVMGINTALRISDLLHLQISHFLDGTIFGVWYSVLEYKRYNTHKSVY